MLTLHKRLRDFLHAQPLISATMPCFHKFYQDLTLERLDFAPTTLIIGTFNPAWPLQNQASWFYGRTRNNYFWEVLPRIYGEPSLRMPDNKAQWTAFCRRHHIAVTDFIACLRDADDTLPEHHQWLLDYKDSTLTQRFKSIETTPILDLLERHPSIQYVYLTRQAGLPFFDALWQPIVAYCRATHRYAQTLPTPSGNARFKMGAYKKQHPDVNLSLADFLTTSWAAMWHF